LRGPGIQNTKKRGGGSGIVGERTYKGVGESKGETKNKTGKLPQLRRLGGVLGVNAKTKKTTNVGCGRGKRSKGGFFGWSGRPDSPREIFNELEKKSFGRPGFHQKNDRKGGGKVQKGNRRRKSFRKK